MSTGWSHLLRVVGALVVIAGVAGVAVYGLRDITMWVVTVVGALITLSATLFNLDVRLEAVDPSKRRATPQRALTDEQRAHLAQLCAGDGVRVADGTRRAAAVGLAVSVGLLGGLLVRAWLAKTLPIVAVPAFILGLGASYAVSAWLRLRRAAVAPGLYCDGHALVWATVDDVVVRRLDGALITMTTSRRDDGTTAVSLALRDETIETVVLVDAQRAARLVELLRVPASAELDAPLEGPPAPEHLRGEGYRALQEPSEARTERIMSSLERGARGAGAENARARRQRAAIASGVALASAAALVLVSSVAEQRRFLARCTDNPDDVTSYNERPDCSGYFKRFDVHLLAGAARDRIAALHRARFTAARDTPDALRALIRVDTRTIPGLDAERAAKLDTLYKIGGARRLRELYARAERRLGSARCRGLPPKVAQVLRAKLVRARAGDKPVLPVIVRADAQAASRPIKLGGLYGKAGVHVESPKDAFTVAKNARRARAIAGAFGRALGRLIGTGTLQTPARWRVDTSKLHVAISYTVTPDAAHLFQQRRTITAWAPPSHFIGLRFSWSFELYDRGQSVFRVRRENAPPRSLTVTTYGYAGLLGLGASADNVYERMVQIAIIRFIEQLSGALGHC